MRRKGVGREVGRRIGHNIAIARTQTGLLQVDLAERVGVGSETVSRWENGKLLPPIPQLLKLATVLGVDVAWLLTAGAMETHSLAEALRGQQGVPESLMEQIKQLSPERRRELARELLQDLL